MTVPQSADNCLSNIFLGKWEVTFYFYTKIRFHENIQSLTTRSLIMKSIHDGHVTAHKSRTSLESVSPPSPPSNPSSPSIAAPQSHPVRRQSLSPMIEFVIDWNRKYPIIGHRAMDQMAIFILLPPFPIIVSRQRDPDGRISREISIGTSVPDSFSTIIGT